MTAIPFIPFPNTAQVNFYYHQGGQVWLNVLHYTNTVDFVESTLADLANNLFDLWASGLKAFQHTGVELNELRAIDLSSEAGPISSVLPLTGNTGTQAGNAMAYNCCLSLTLQTASRGRSYRGRIYLGGLLEEQTADSVWSNDLLDNIDTFATSLITVSGAFGEYHLCVASRQLNGVLRTTGVSTPVTTIRVNPVVASQRRRLPGRGR